MSESLPLVNKTLSLEDSSKKRVMRVLYVSNKGGQSAAESDYRLIYGKLTKVCSITYALPERPPSIDDKHFVQLRFGEGFRLSYILELQKLWSHLNKNRNNIDLVHFYSSLLILCGPIIAWLAAIPSIVTVTGLGRTFTNTGGWYKFIKFAYLFLFGISIRFASRVLFQNHGDLDFLAGHFPDKQDKFFHIGSGITMEEVHDKCFTSPKLRVLLVTRLLSEKGIEDFLAVAERLNERKTFEFILVGPGSRGHESLLQKVKDFHDHGLITFLGELSPPATLGQFAKAHIFFFPSVYGEGIARVMLECGFSQVCPIAYDISANRDLMGEGRGFFSKARDIEAVIAILVTLEHNRLLLETNACAYQEFITKNYDMNVFSARMDRVLIELTQKTGI